MKTTIDLPDSLYRRARVRAAEQGTTLRALVVQALERNLNEPAPPVPHLPHRDRFRADEEGWPVLRRAPGDTTVITEDFVNRLRDEEGV